MVAPHQVEDIVRSFVRVPGSGDEKSARPALCDLARASTMAASISVPQNLPRTTIIRTQTPSVTPIHNNQQRKRPTSEERSITGITPKVIRIEASSAAVPIKTIPVTLTAAVRIPNAEVQNLKEENEQLRKENDTLKKHLSLFKQLIRNPQRLNRVLRRLEEKAQEAMLGATPVLEAKVCKMKAINKVEISDNKKGSNIEIKQG